MNITLKLTTRSAAHAWKTARKLAAADPYEDGTPRYLVGRTCMEGDQLTASVDGLMVTWQRKRFEVDGGYHWATEYKVYDIREEGN